MPILSKPSLGPAMAISYITVGALLDVWSGIWYVYMRNNDQTASWKFYLCAGTFLSGIVLLVIGLLLGQIGRSARQAELPPEEVTDAVKRADNVAAERGQPMPVGAPGMPGMPVMVVTSPMAGAAPLPVAQPAPPRS